MSTRERRILLLVIAAGVVLRALHTVTSLGSADSLTWVQNILTMERAGGVLRAYFEDRGLNHPPLSLAIARAVSEVSKLAGVEFQDAFRLLQTLADVVTALALARLAGLYAATLFMLSPAAIFITGFHCQSDPMMTMLVVLAVVATVEKRALPAGIAIGCAAGIKIIALVALPLLLLRFRGRDVLRYLGAAAAVGALVFGPAIAVTGTVMLRNVFLYTGLSAGWGLKFVLWPLLRDFAELRPMLPLLPLLLLAALAALWFAELRRRNDEDDRLRVARIVGTALLLVLVLAPAFGVQYLFWPLPFLALVLRRTEALALHGIISAFLFAMYTTWSGGWPWWFGSHKAGAPAVWWARWVWIALLLALSVSVWRLYMRRAA